MLFPMLVNWLVEEYHCSFISIRQTGQDPIEPRLTPGENSNVSLVKPRYPAVNRNFSTVRDRRNMGESLFGKLRDVLSREKTSDIDTAVNIAASPATLARIGLATGRPVSPATPSLGSPAPEMPVAGIHQEPVAGNVAPVGIQFFC